MFQYILDIFRIALHYSSKINVRKSNWILCYVSVVNRARVSPCSCSTLSSLLISHTECRWAFFNLNLLIGYFTVRIKNLRKSSRWHLYMNRGIMKHWSTRALVMKYLYYSVFEIIVPLTQLRAIRKTIFSLVYFENCEQYCSMLLCRGGGGIISWKTIVVFKTMRWRKNKENNSSKHLRMIKWSFSSC